MRAHAASTLLIAALLCLSIGFLITVNALHGGDSRAWVQGGLVLGFSSLLFRP